MDKANLEEWVEQHREEFISFLVDLVRTPSESGQEQDVAR